jgi:F420-non-reducing hydrogenase iron-sulfur subunit
VSDGERRTGDAPAEPSDGPDIHGQGAPAADTAGAFEPRIVGILCNWCSYAGADLAGISRIQYPPNIRVVRVMCSGRVDPQLVIFSLMEGFDGVLALGCHPGDCHYQSGNLEAREKFETLLKLLEATGVGPRFRYEWVSASEGQRFADVVSEFTDHIRGLGPTPVPGDDGVRFRLRAALREVGDFRLRWLVGRQRHILADGDAYGDKVDEAEWGRVMERILREQFIRAQIIERTVQGSATVEEIAEVVGVGTEEVFRHVQRLRSKGRVVMSGHKDQSPLYRATGVGCE